MIFFSIMLLQHKESHAVYLELHETYKANIFLIIYDIIK